MKSAFLPDRGVLKITGADAKSFLNNLITSDIGQTAPGQARFGALLTPQGKIIADFLVTEIAEGLGGGLLLDVPKELAAPLAARLSMYKLRAKVVIENLTDDMGVLAVWGGEITALPDLSFADPRAPGMGHRIFIPQDVAEKAASLLGAEVCSADDYDAHRIACAVPKGGVDFKYSDAFPHEANMDRLHGVDFDKGCYIGQEVVSRMQHRGTARTRILRVTSDSLLPAAGSEIRAGEKPVGMLGASAGQNGLALLRTDRVADALDAGLPLVADGVTIRLVSNEDVQNKASGNHGA